ncbi:hypothetical protein LR48_Vigan03g109700 [Vigna angularis]|uniref:Uncharacterized protein n=1 Tax=Phaseolus angularis TaxID=3914 RepID=A0A0L9U4K0_PHAAN|nr:hypothetical protein LR48_Vigan03g109700 [Vigna angularis]
MAATTVSLKVGRSGANSIVMVMEVARRATTIFVVALPVCEGDKIAIRMVGRATFTGNYQWILMNNFSGDAYPPEIIIEGFCPSVITEGFCPSVITEGQRPSVMVSDKGFTDGHLTSLSRR